MAQLQCSEDGAPREQVTESGMPEIHVCGEHPEYQRFLEQAQEDTRAQLVKRLCHTHLNDLTQKHIAQRIAEQGMMF